MSQESDNQTASKTTIRLATAADALGLAQMRYRFRAALGPVNENDAMFIERCRQWMEARLHEKSLWRCWVAEQDDTLIGNLWMQLIEKVPNPVVEAEYHAYITNVFVDEAARGQGLGAMLMQTALDDAKARDVHAVILWPTERSRSLYGRFGFAVRDDLLEMIFQEDLT
jgi:GNAT superfamily N-acetyltransferase